MDLYPKELPHPLILFLFGLLLSAIKVGLTSQSAAEITANIETAIPHIIEKIPRKWKNVQAINLKTNNSIALPIYNSLPEDGTTRINVQPSKKGKAIAMDLDNGEEEEDEDEEEEEEEDDE
jgi:ribosome biogenesis protein UTP30